jgi:hypothetical protein
MVDVVLSVWPTTCEYTAASALFEHATAAVAIPLIVPNRATKLLFILNFAFQIVFRTVVGTIRPTVQKENYPRIHQDFE